MVQVAIYVRLSDEDRYKASKEDDSVSIQNQKSMLIDYCKERNWDIYDIYNDDNYSGADQDRPNWKRMLNDCEHGKIDVVLCKSQSRFSRDMEVIERYLHNKFIEWRVRFISIVDHADTDDTYNKKSRQINSLMNEWYLADVSENVKRTLRHKRKMGDFTGSFAPYGYLIDPDNKNHLIVDENTAPVVRDIFNWTVQGWGQVKIIHELNNRKILTPTQYKKSIHSNYKNPTNDNNEHWSKTTIRNMLRNETYIGNLVQGKKEYISYKNHKLIKAPEEKWIRAYNTHEPIIDQTTWDIVQNKIKNNIRSSTVTQCVYPLSGKVKCACCNRPMRRISYYNKKRTIQYYRLQCVACLYKDNNCDNNASIKGLQLEKIILERINKFISDNCNFEKIKIDNNTERELKRLQEEEFKLQQDITNQEDKLTKLYEDKLDDVITLSQYKLFYEKFVGETAKLQEQLKDVSDQIKALSQQIDNVDYLEQLKHKYTHITELSRTVVEEFIDTIYVGKYIPNEEREITIKWKF